MENQCRYIAVNETNVPWKKAMYSTLICIDQIVSMLTGHNVRKRVLWLNNVLQKVVKENWMPKKKWGNDFKYHALVQHLRIIKCGKA